jgi:cobalamin synthase
MQSRGLIRRWCLTALGVALCLLAAVFSFEAKIAWYSSAPAQTEISAAKLQPAEAPRLVAQALFAQTSAPPAYFAHLDLQLAWLVVFALLAAALVARCCTDFDLTPTFASPGFSPFSFSRPPPKR